MKRFEYRTELIAHRDGTYHHDLPVHYDDVDAVLNNLGAEGWEVWALDGSMIRLKREIEPPQEDVTAVHEELPPFGLAARKIF